MPTRSYFQAAGRDGGVVQYAEGMFSQPNVFLRARGLSRSPLPLVALAGLILALLAACTAPVAPAPLARQKVRFMAGYKPQANLPFVGVYVAQKLGYFDARG